MKSVLSDKRIIVAGIALAGLGAWTTGARADALSVSPEKTTVLILPVANQLADGGRFAGLDEAIANHRLEYEFLSRQFSVVGPAMASAEAKKAGIDVADPTKRTSDTLKKMADLTKADWVVSVDILEYKHDTFTPGNRTDHSKMHIIVFDTKTGSFLADKDVLKTKNSGGQSIGVLGLMVATVDTTTQAAVQNLLKSYPQTVKVADETGTDDYLYGQVKPVAGDPKKPFTALGTPPPSTGAVQVTN
jgi:hypothetical protein